jgi:hypothetical protein
VLEGLQAELLPALGLPAIDGGEVDPEQVRKVLGAEPEALSNGTNFDSVHAPNMAYAKAGATLIVEFC